MDIGKFVSELDAGVFEQRLERVLRDLAIAAINLGKKGSCIIKLELEQIGATPQVQVRHTIDYVRPTSNGKVREQNTTITPMHVGSGGTLSFFPENQTQLFTVKGEPNE